jgi:hypothetical protein
VLVAVGWCWCLLFFVIVVHVDLCASLHRFTFHMSRGPGRTFLYQRCVVLVAAGLCWCLLFFVIVVDVGPRASVH